MRRAKLTVPSRAWPAWKKKQTRKKLNIAIIKQSRPAILLACLIKINKINMYEIAPMH